MMDLPLISVIICTFNRSGLLHQCLSSLMTSYDFSDSFEVIVVDNNSEDDTSEVVSRHAEKVPNVRYVKEEQLGLSYARNRGCDEARGSYLVFLDDDTMVPKDYLFQLLGVIQKHSPDIIGGPVFPYYDTPKPRWFKDEYEIKRFEDSSGFSATCRVTGANFTIRKDVLVKLGKFDVNLGMKGNQLRLGEERAVLESYRRQTPLAQQRVYYALEVYVNHYVPAYKMTLRYMIRRSYQAGRTMYQIKNKDPASALWRIKAFFPEQLSFLIREIRKKGMVHAGYADFMFNTAVRTGNIAELLSHGWRPVLKPHIRPRYGKFRFWLKKRGMKRFLWWYEKKLGIKLD
jgi:glycosyltransferase involved in cell wall biosynthesis